MNNDKMLSVLTMIQEDVKNDAIEFDSQEFNGENVATYFGNHGAAISALAAIIKELIENTQQ